jgi:DNA repair protein RadC
VNAASVVAVHNHPSGDPTPSPEDRAVTKQLSAAGTLLDIPLHDHLVVTADQFFSFGEAELL